MSKTLVAYFSCSGMTKKLANTLSEVVNGDMFEIKPVVPYTDEDLDWHDKNSRSSVEMRDYSSRPDIYERVENMDEYDTVFVGFPIWWYVAPTIINAFLESYDFSGKNVIPFATSGMSDVGETDKYLHRSCSKKTNWRASKRFPNNTTSEDLKKWVDTLNL